jgi:hypothetical protein
VAEPLEQLFRREMETDDLKPTFVNYRNPQDDKIQLALQEAARRLRAQGKPLVKATDDK